jgi:hypothetical protein
MRALFFWLIGKCDHDWSQWQPFDLRADEPGGPRTYHDFRRVCRKCGVTST